MQRGFAPILILVGILIIAAVAGGAYYLGQNNPSLRGSGGAGDVAISPTPLPTSSPADETANWKTYTNTKYGYSLRYPANFFITESNALNIDTTIISNFDQHNLSGYKKNPSDSEWFLMYITNPFPGNETDIVKAKSKSKDQNPQDFIVGGVIGFKILGGLSEKGESVIIVYNSKEYIFQLQSLDSKYASYFDQILSTFKFTQ